ncbi:MAG: radical SAM protein [Sandaracinaceae bacterium]|nr:radical SAM protein [Sandaracinaceae bacterium]
MYAVWELTLACDLSCQHCGSRAGEARSGELSPAQALDIVDQLADVGVREVTLIGGEAYLREDWLDITRALVGRGVVVGMTTGGFALDAARVQQAEDAGLRAISLSIDGIGQTHDAQRGRKGAYDAALAAARRVAASGIHLSVNTQINRLSLPELPALARLMAELGADDWRVQLTVPLGNAADRADLVLQPVDLLDLFPLLAWMQQTLLEPAGIRLRPGNNVGYFGPYEEWVRYQGAEGAHYSRCGAGEYALGIEADGTLKGCPSLPTTAYAGGDLRVTRLRELLTREPLRRLAERTVDDLHGFCRTCYYAEPCRGGCSYTAHAWLGRPGDNPLCIHRALAFEAEGKHERLVRVEPASGRPFDHGRFEIRVEDLPARDAPTLAGVPLARAAAARPSDGGAHSVANLRRRLRVL